MSLLESEPALREEPSNRDILRERGLCCEDLGTFEDPRILIPEVLGVCLQEADKEIVLWADKNTEEAGHAYMKMLGIQEYNIRAVDNPVNEVQDGQENNTINLVVTSAINPKLKELMFTNPNFGQLFADGIYLEEEGFQSPLLYCIGVTAKSLDEMKEQIKTISESDEFDADELAKARSEAQKPFSREDQLTFWEIREMLKSDQVKKVIAHGLGPEGTNISQALRKWVKAVGIDDKTEIIIHPRGVEPFDPNDGGEGYADIAAKQVESGVVPVHMECAVYYNQWRLWQERGKNEIIFADHHYMPLDKMMVVGKKDLSYLLKKEKIIIATHPSPQSLVRKWLDLADVDWIKATSNSAAAEMVAEGKADLCITTSQGLAALQNKLDELEDEDRLEEIHNCGSPMMVFTVATT
ncbi:hypothetical protein ISS85_00900 [Candidatus Microgenomates bacterium]|nr:hypothetical protein [Candidatus Microgenomates bacterium]